MVVRDQSCKQCGMLNCSRHAGITTNITITQRLTNLLEHFESPDEDMRTFIQPERTKSATTSRPDALNCDNKTSHNDNASKHLSEIEKVTPMPSSSIPGRAMVLVGPAEAIPESRTTTQTPKNDGITRLSHGKGYKAHERHHFVRIHNTSFTSCASPTGAYSEIVFVIWVDSKPFLKYSASTDKYRVVVSLIYDAEDELWSVSSKLLKRASYGIGKDEEEGQIFNRLCITSELCSEVKKMLLFLGISPREAYKMFRRNMEETFIISSSEYGFVAVESASHGKLMNSLEKPHSSQGWESVYGTSYCSGHGYDHHSDTRHRMRERDTNRIALASQYDAWNGMD